MYPEQSTADEVGDESAKDETETPQESADGSQKPAAVDRNKASSAKVLMGVMRVGLFAKCLMLDGDLLAELVVICVDKPTSTLLHHIATLLATEILVSLVYLYCNAGRPTSVLSVKKSISVCPEAVLTAPPRVV